VPAGEKIRFTDEPNNSAPPTRPKPEFSRPFEFKPNGPGTAEVTPLPPPTPNSKVRDPRIEEFIDQKKNWIFGTPPRPDSEEALKEVFNIREYKFDEVFERKSKSAVDRYFDRDVEARKEIGARLNARDPGEMIDSEDAEEISVLGLPVDQQARPSFAPGADLDPNIAARAKSDFSSAVTDGPTELRPSIFNSAEVLGFSRRDFGNEFGPSSIQEQREQRMLEFQRILSGNSGGVLRDPINAQPDRTRQAINPIVGTRSQGLSSGLDGGLSSGGALSGSIGGSPISDVLAPRIPIGSSLAPAAILPAAPTFAPRPAVLEIPRRKF
jgi:hypothetical protein